MRNLLLLILSMLYVCNLSAQHKITETWECKDSSVVFTNVTIKSNKVDTTYQYRNDSLVHVRIECDTLKVEYTVNNGIWKWFSTKKTTIERIIIKDGRCNGIKLDGDRCSRTVKGENVYCWQHKK